MSGAWNGDVFLRNGDRNFANFGGPLNVQYWTEGYNIKASSIGTLDQETINFFAFEALMRSCDSLQRLTLSVEGINLTHTQQFFDSLIGLKSTKTIKVLNYQSKMLVQPEHYQPNMGDFINSMQSLTVLNLSSPIRFIPSKNGRLIISEKSLMKQRPKIQKLILNSPRLVFNRLDLRILLEETCKNSLQELTLNQTSGIRISLLLELSEIIGGSVKKLNLIGKFYYNGRKDNLKTQTYSSNSINHQHNYVGHYNDQRHRNFNDNKNMNNKDQGKICLSDIGWGDVLRRFQSLEVLKFDNVFGENFKNFKKKPLNYHRLTLQQNHEVEPGLSAINEVSGDDEGWANRIRELETVQDTSVDLNYSLRMSKNVVDEFSESENLREIEKLPDSVKKILIIENRLLTSRANSQAQTVNEINQSKQLNSNPSQNLYLKSENSQIQNEEEEDLINFDKSLQSKILKFWMSLKSLESIELNGQSLERPRYL
ncbi:hypothetical protein BY996DRAFT_2645628 [Phakopsora pachyrhizi]|nr:hypothetical protein BY996DRAFT_2645628 [Phakopsora pachyrhizi]